MFNRPRHGQRPSAEKNQNHRLAGVDNSFQQFLLSARKSEMCARSCLPTHLRSLPQRQNNDISVLSARHGGCNLLVRAVENARPP